MPRPSNPTAVLARIRRQRIATLQHALNKARIDISMHKLRTYDDVIAQLGLADRSGPWCEHAGKGVEIGVASFVKDVANPLMEQLSVSLLADVAKLNGNEHDTSKAPAPESDATATDSVAPVQAEIQQGIEAVAQQRKESTTEEEEATGHPVDSSEYWLDDLPGRRCTLFRHQIRAAKDALYQLYVLQHRAALLRAAVGTGKTFIFFEIISQLHRLEWFKGKSFSPWPVCIVTKASIVEQTKRVGVEMFGLDPFRQFKVINYDGLRSAAGSNMITTTTIVEDGIPRKRWDWNPGVHPMLFILDECQSAKNEDSQQSEICQAIARIEDPNVRVICSSATPFTRVSEAKYFCLNAHITYSVI